MDPGKAVSLGRARNCLARVLFVPKIPRALSPWRAPVRDEPRMEARE
jgi:hypothetical protein